MTKHTPGPWVVTGKLEMPEDAHTYNRMSNTIETEGGTLVLAPWDAESYNAGFYITPGDARLIATAPDLLAVLVELMTYWDGWEDVQCQEPIVDRARAAIRKATDG